MEMAIRSLKIKTVLIYAFLLAAGTGHGKTELKEIPDPRAVEAYKYFWTGFEEYEQELFEKGQNIYQKKWEELKSRYRKTEDDNRKIQLETLLKANDKYSIHLEKLAEAHNKPFVILNKAQILHKIAIHMRKSDAQGGSSYDMQALTYLVDLEKEYPRFEKIEEALYLKALIQQSLNQPQSAYETWLKLGRRSRGNLYGVHANIAVGDFLFNKERSIEALKYYKRAYRHIKAIKTPDKDFETLRVQYRLSWAAYRAAELKTCIETAAEMLKPGRMAHSLRRKQKIEEDGIELIGDALYELNDQDYTMTILRRKSLMNSSPKIGLRVMRRYLASEMHKTVVAIGDSLVKRAPTALEYPEWLSILAHSWGELKNNNQRHSALEKLALILPEQSLWRSRHHKMYQNIQTMEKKAADAARIISANYYNHGMGSGNKASFRSAAAYFDILLNHEPNGENSNRWRLKRAHCDYFSGDLKGADERYYNLKNKYQISITDLEISAYQLVMTREKVWRSTFAKSMYSGKDPNQDPVVIQELKALEKSIEEFANRFPNKNRTVDLLLTGGAANRDQNRFETAKKYWQRALVSNPTKSQRSIAIRGIVFATMESNQPADVIKLTRKYLRLEDWNSLGITLGNELRGVLSSAALKESENLNKKGDVNLAGSLLVDLATEFDNLPQKSTLYRDGAYMLAISGEWSKALEATNKYINGKDRKKMADMYYLKARSQEYLMQFENSAKSYLLVGQKFPKHPRHTMSLNRAEKLAVAEGDYDLAAEAASLKAKYTKRNKDKVESLKNAIHYYGEAGDIGKAIETARTRYKASRKVSDRLESQLLMAKYLYENGQENNALKNWRSISKKSKKQRHKMDESEWSEILGESWYQLGEESRRKFEDYTIIERDGQVMDKISRKMNYYEELVKNYNTAIRGGSPKWTSMSRFRIGEAGEELADEIANIYRSPNSNLKVNDERQMKQFVSRLRNTAKKYYSDNVLARNKDPAAFKRNHWIDRSHVKLSGYHALSNKYTIDDELPIAGNILVPQQWSL